MRQLDWHHATVSPGRMSVPLDGSPDDDWIDRFHTARGDALKVRRLEQLPHLQIELRGGEVAVTEIAEGGLDGARSLLTALVDAANRRPRGVSGPWPVQSDGA